MTLATSNTVDNVTFSKKPTVMTTFNSTDTNTTDSPQSNITFVLSTIEIPPEAFQDRQDPSYVFNHYNEPSLFPIVIPDDVNMSEFDRVADSEVLGFTIPGTTVTNLNTTPITYTVQSLRGRRGEVKYE